MDAFHSRTPQTFDDLYDVDATDTTEGYVPTRQADGTFAMAEPAGGLSAFVVEAGHVESDGTVLWRWGETASGQPYFDSDGADAGEEQIVTLEDGRFYYEGAPL